MEDCRSIGWDHHVILSVVKPVHILYVVCGVNPFIMILKGSE